MLRRGLQIVLTLLGAVAITFGLLSAVLGASFDAGGADVAPTVDSEFRFYAAWYVVAGIFALRAVPRIETERFTILALSAGALLGGSARVLSMIQVGTPRPIQIALTIIELALPFILVPWQLAVARRAHR